MCSSSKSVTCHFTTGIHVICEPARHQVLYGLLQHLLLSHGPMKQQHIVFVTTTSKESKSLLSPKAKVCTFVLLLGTLSLLFSFIRSTDNTLQFRPPLSPKSVIPPRMTGLTLDNTTFTAVVMAVKQYQSLERVLQLGFEGLTECSAISVIWNDLSLAPPAPTDFNVSQELRNKIRVFPQKANDINNRFVGRTEIRTEAVYAFDDDVVLAPDRLRKAFKLWQMNKEVLVGWEYIGRGYTKRKKQSGEPYYEYATAVGVRCILLTSGFFYHQKYNGIYEFETPSQVRQFVTENMNGEDIAMNFIVANRTRQRSIAINNVRPKELSRPDGMSLSARGKHYLQRTRALNTFVRVFGYMPLLPFRGAKI